MNISFGQILSGPSAKEFNASWVQDLDCNGMWAKVTSPSLGICKWLLQTQRVQVVLVEECPRKDLDRPGTFEVELTEPVWIDASLAKELVQIATAMGPFFFLQETWKQEKWNQLSLQCIQIQNPQLCIGKNDFKNWINSSSS